jgi:glucose-6-phosphate isomerase
MTTLKDFVQTLSDFSRYKATKKLKQFAENPFDLTKEGNLTSQRIAKFCASACGYHFLYGTERVNEDVMHTLVELAHEAGALHKMERLQAGETMNVIRGFPSENRPALHTATRDFFENPQKSRVALEATKDARKQIDKLKHFLTRIDREGRFNTLISVGIGGSDLGPKAHYIALQHLLKKERHIYFISNMDPDDAALVLRQVDLNSTLVLVISKSGTTLETAANETLLRKRFLEAGLKPEEHFISITCEGSPQDNPKKYLECFHVWDWIGGRYSTTSMVGGVMLAFAFGFDVFWEFLRGAHAMDQAALNPDINKNLPLLGALLGIWNRDFLHHPNLAIIPYSQALARYSAHIQQLDMESDGKRIDQKGNPVDFETGPIIFGEPGTSAQHSFYQLLHQGTTVVPLEFIGFKQSQCKEDIEIDGTTMQEKLIANLFAQAIALATGKLSDNPNKVFPGNRPSHILLGKQLTPFSLGVLLAYFEHKVAFQGFVWGINSFDQEGVQLGKEVANHIIKRIAFHQGHESGDQKSYPLGDAFIKFLDET